MPYRYLLSRTIAHGDRSNAAVWVMLNPSTATETVDDPTIRKVVGFSDRLGFAEAVVVNLFAARATDPRDLLAYDDPIGPENDGTLRAAFRHPWLIAAWGVPKWKWVEKRVVDVLSLRSGPMFRLGPATKGGHPRHPLYVRYGTTLEVHQAGESNGLTG